MLAAQKLQLLVIPRMTWREIFSIVGWHWRKCSGGRSPLSKSTVNKYLKQLYTGYWEIQEINFQFHTKGLSLATMHSGYIYVCESILDIINIQYVNYPW